MGGEGDQDNNPYGADKRSRQDNPHQDADVKHEFSHNHLPPRKIDGILLCPVGRIAGSASV